MNENCNLCNADSFELIKSELRDEKEKFKVYSCNSCGHIQLMPKPSEEDDREFYDKNLQDKGRDKEIDYEKLSTNNQFDTSRHVKLIREVHKDTGGKILDIGSGYGFFVNGLSMAGYKNILGIEVSDERRDLALRHTDVRIIDLDINDPAEEIGSFNVVTLFHVLEHMSDPIEFLRNIRKFLAPGGLFICEVPNVKEFLLQNCSAYNDFYWIRAHLNYFGDKALSDCFKRAGYNNVEIRFEQRYGLTNLVNWLETGKPQIKKPAFEIKDGYKHIEELYRENMKENGTSDALIAIVRV